MTKQLLHTLPSDHPLRNTPLRELDVSVRHVNLKQSRDPRTWKIRDNTFNELGSNWMEFFEFEVVESNDDALARIDEKLDVMTL